MNIEAQIQEAEKHYMGTLEVFLSHAMGGVKLESHGPDHHRRVWTFAKQIITAPGFFNAGIETDFVKKLLIASFLHDSGMAIDTGPRHGVHSRSFCEKYLTEIGESADNYKDLLSAIELHDNKEYNTEREASSLESVLNFADDLDAFGYTGIYRYLEIYLERKSPYRTVGDEIRKNASGRYRNIEKVLISHPEIINYHRERYMILDTFFRNYNSEARSYRFGTPTPSGYCGVAELIGESVKRRDSLKDLIIKSSDSKYDNKINHFFLNLEKEITSYSYGQ